ncbi:beta strand repeat-containing protein [Clostridium sp. WILCCON 0269]|uniref:Beta strand repeat-containing protein n=1 Tax=Candidatus Clostridium eludens TaxID=3381663 RepID=A0ABW8SGK5_9CLOT
MANKKIYMGLTKIAIATIIATSLGGVAYAKDGDIYKLPVAPSTSVTNEGGIGNIVLNKSSLLDLIVNMSNYGYEAGGKIYKASDANAQWNANPTAAAATIYAAIAANATPTSYTPVAAAGTISSVSAINGTVTVTFSSALAAAPALTDFAVTQTIGTGTATTVVPTAVTMDSTNTIATLTVPTVTASTADQSVVDSVSYKGATAVIASAFTVAPAGLAVSSVSAINSTTLGVTINGTLTDAQKSATTFTVTKDGSTPVAVTATWNGNTANLVKADGSKLIAGSYSVKVASSGVTFTTDTATGTVAAEKATSIKINTARILNAASQVLSYEVDNQYGEKMNLASNLLTVMVYNTTAPSRTVSNTNVTLDASGANVGDVLKVTAYLASDPTVTVSSNITVANITVGSVTIGDLVPNTGNDRVSIGDTGVVLPITLTDDAGSAFLPTHNGAIATGATYDGLTYTYSGITALSYSTTTKQYTCTATAMPATITISDAASGQVVTKTLTLNPVATAQTAAFGDLTGNIVSGDTTNLPKLPVNFTDQYGKSIVLANSTALTSTPFVAQVTGAGAIPLAVSANITNTNGQDYLTFSNIPTATAGTYTLTLTNVNTGKQVSTNLTVNAARVPTTLSEETTPSASIIGTGTTNAVFDVIDQYGQKVSSNANYDIKATTTSGGSGIVTVTSTTAIASPTTITITGVAAGTDTITFTLEKASDGTVIDTKSVPVTDIATVASYAATTDKTSYTAGDTMTITVNALNGTGQPYTAYNGSGVATVTLTPNAGSAITYLRNLQFVNGVATTTVPVTVADSTGTAVQVAYDSNTATVATSPTVTAAAMSKLGISATVAGTTATINAEDASGNILSSYTGTKIVKVTYVDSTGAAKAVTGADVDGNVQVTFTSGVGTVTLGTAVASGDKITASVDGFTGTVTK